MLFETELQLRDLAKHAAVEARVAFDAAPHLLEQRANQVGHREVFAVECVLEHRFVVRHDLARDRLDQRALRAEVVEHGRPGHTCLGRDVRHGDVVEPVRREQAVCRVENPRLLLGPVALALAHFWTRV